MRRLMIALALALSATTMLVPPAHAGNTVPPSVIGSPTYAATLTADPGQWSPAAPGYAFQWLRSGVAIPGAVAATYTAGLDDLGQPLAVQVSATDGSGAAVSAPTIPVAPATMTAKRQKVVGDARWTGTLKARPGRFSAPDAAVTYAWPDGSTGRSYAIRLGDVGGRVEVAITAEAPGYAPLTVDVASPTVQHRIGVRRVVRYHVETRGRITTSLEEFKARAQETFEDPRGWRSAGIEFRPVAKGGAFTLVLSQAGLVPSFSSACSSMWSCRVGRHVVINQDRWKDASPAWNAAGQALRDYRHMVVDHETGHWLGLGHASCPGPGRLAPVMQQQSKGLQGCRFNPFPTDREIGSRTPSARKMTMAQSRGYPRVEVE